MMLNMFYFNVNDYQVMEPSMMSVTILFFSFVECESHTRSKNNPINVTTFSNDLIGFAENLDTRFKTSEALTREVTRLVRLHPMAVSHIPDAVHYLVTAHSVEADAPEVC